MGGEGQGNTRICAYTRGSFSVLPYPMRPTTGRHATYGRCHDIAEDESITIDAIIKTDNKRQEELTERPRK